MSEDVRRRAGEMPPPIPHRKLAPGRLVIASHNEGKVREIRALLAPYGIEPVSAASLDLPEPEETGTTFAANAELKARAAADLSGLPALADDSGLCVEALGGDPGIFSARWAGPDKDFGLAMRLVHDHLEQAGPEAGPRRAFRLRAVAVLARRPYRDVRGPRRRHPRLAAARRQAASATIRCSVPNGHDQTFGEIDPAAKHAMSHRADAFAKLVAAVF